MRHLLTILSLTLSSFCYSQFNGYTAKQDTCLDKKFSLVFYVILDSSYTVGSATPLNIQKLVDTLNVRFKNVCISFQNCSTVHIPLYHAKGWYKDVTEKVITDSWYTENTINVYLPDTVYPPQGGSNVEVEGYTYYPTAANLATPKKDLIVVDKYKMLLNRCALPLHLLGHYFGLPHTHSEMNPLTNMPWPSPATPPPPNGVETHEFANGTMPNCATHGDGFCDTEADALLTFPTDGMGNYYISPLDNLMSYYNSTRCRFTSMQYYHMVYTIMTKRSYLH